METNLMKKLPQIVAIVTPGNITLPDMEKYEHQANELAKLYDSIVYSENVEDQIKEMKADRAYLNKQKDEIDSERKRIKNIFMNQVQGVEDEFKRLTAILDAPIGKIDQGIKFLEQERRNRKFQEIKEFFNEVTAVQIEEHYREEFFQKIYQPSWTNATATKKAYRDGILSAIESYQKGILQIKEMNAPEFEEEAIRIFQAGLQIGDAMAYVSRMQIQKEEILRREREHIERETRKQIEQEIAEKSMNSISDKEFIQKTTVPDTRIPMNTLDNKKHKSTLYVRVEGGILSGIYFDSDVDIVLVDDEINSKDDLADFQIKTSNLNRIF